MDIIERRKRILMTQPHLETKSGTAVQFKTDVKQVLPFEISLTPKQELNGQDSPYTPGGMAQKWDEQWELGIYDPTTGLPDDTVTTQIRCKNPIPVKAETSYYFRTNGANSRVLFYTSNDTYISSDLYKNAVFTTPASCAYVRFHLGTSYGTTYNNNVCVNYPETVTTYYPYSNICPITGYTNVKIVRTGKNLCGGDQWLNTSAGTVDRQNRTVTGSAASSTLPALYEVIPESIFKVKTSYTLILSWKTTATTGRPGLGFMYTDGTYDALKHEGMSANTKTTSVFVSNPNKTVRNIARLGYSGTKTFYVDECGLFEGVLTAEDFEPFRNVYSIAMPNEAGTVYHGKLEVYKDGTGKLTADSACVTFDGTETWERVGNVESVYKYYRSIIASSGVLVDPDRTDKYSNLYPKVAIGSTTLDEGFNVYKSSNGKTYVGVRPFDTVGTSVSAMTDMFAEYGLQVVYHLKTPVEYSLTAEQVSALKGLNSIWAYGFDDASTKYWTREPV